MSYDYDAEYSKLRKKRKKEEEEAKKKSSTKTTNTTNKKTNTVTNKPYAQKLTDEIDIAPVMKKFTPITSAPTTTSKKKDSEDLPLYKKIIKKPELFDDGYQAGEVAATILGTAGDLTFNVVKGAGNLFEGITDAIGYGIADVSDKIGADNFADKVREKAKANVVEKILGESIEAYDKWSVLGDTTDAVAQGLGMVGAMALGGAALGGVGLGKGAVSAITTGATGLSGFGSGMSEAYEGGATDEEARTYGLISGTSEALTELLFGGLGKVSKALGYSKGLLSLDDMAAKKVSNMFSNQIAKNLAEYGIKSSAEGLEEVLSGIAQGVGKKITYMSEEDLSKILKDENLLEQFVVGSVTSSIAQGGDLVRSTSEGRDFITGLNENEQKVVDKEVENRIKAKEENGEKVNKKAKDKIYDDVIRDLDKGYIDTDTIESVLGGEEYESYKKAKDLYDGDIAKGEELIKTLEEGSKKLQEEYDSLNKVSLTEATLGDKNRQTQIKEKQAEIKETIEKTQAVLENLKKDTRVSDLKADLSQKVSELVKDTGLIESYRELERSEQNFEVDTSKYENEKARQTVQNAVNSGLFGNSNAEHEAVDFMAKVTSKIGLVVEFTNNEKIKNDYIEAQTKKIAELEAIPEAQRTENQIANLKKMKDALAKVQSGKRKVNGSTKKGVITINLDSVEPIEFITGHEILHNLVKSKVYKNEDLQKAFKSYLGAEKYAERLEEVEDTYEGTESTPEEELVANLVGEYIFNDYDFVMHLATTNQNIFQQAWDSINHLYKMATAGSKEARDLERVKRNFEKAYKESAKSGVKVEGTKNSITEAFIDEAGNKYENAVLLDTDFFEGISPRNWGDKLQDEVNKRASTDPFILPIADENGNTVFLQFANPEDNVRKNGGSKHNVLNELSYTSDNLSKLAVIHIDEIISVSEENSPYFTEDNKHGWLDRNGWLHRNANVINKLNGNIYNLTVDIAKAEDGRTILYATKGKIKKVGTVKVNSLKIKGSRQNSNSEDILPQNSEKSSGKTDYSLSEEQENNYNKAVKNKDLETAQRIVDEVARENGYTIHSYHGTRDKNFTEFKKDFIGSRFSFDDKGFFFIDRKSIADDYAHSEFNADAYGRVLDVYLKVKKPLMVDREFCLKEGLGNPFRDDDAIGVWDAYSEFFKEEAENRKSDGIILDDGMSKMTVVFDPNQIKSAEPITYDDNGNVIPLSERFKTENNDIRFSLSDTLEKNGKILYDKNNSLSIVNRATTNNNSSIKWVYDAEIFSVTESKLFHSKISEINTGRHSFGENKNAQGEYMLPIGNKIVFTDGNYDSPYVREIVEILTEIEDEFEEIRKCIFDVEKGKSEKQDEVQFCEKMFGKGRIITYQSGVSGVYGWENGRRKGKSRSSVIRNHLNKQNRRRNDRASQEAQINEIAPVKETSSEDGVFFDAEKTKYSLSDSDTSSKNVYGFSVKQDAKVDEDLLEELSIWHPDAQVDSDGNVTVYHRTSKANADKIRKTGVMTALEDALFFSSKSEGYASDYGDTVVALKIPSTVLRVNDIFDGEVHFDVPLKRINNQWSMNVSKYLVDENANNVARHSLSEEGETSKGYATFYGKRIGKRNTTTDIAPVQPTTEDSPATVSETEKVEVAPTPTSTEPLAETPIRTTKQKISAKLKQSQAELEKNIELREKSIAYYDEKIAKAQADYDAKKNKDTKAANTILRSIERYKRLKGSADADYKKRISDIESRMKKLDDQLLSNHDKADRLEQYKKRAAVRLEADKSLLKEEFDQRRAELQQEIDNKPTFVRNKALQLYNELNGLKKGVRASEELGYFLDFGFKWSELKSTLLKVSRWSDVVLNPESEVESIVREAIIRDYEDKAAYGVDDLEEEYNRQVEELEAATQKRIDEYKEKTTVTRAKLHNSIVERIRTKFAAKGFDFDEVLDKAKNLSTFKTVDNIPQRVMEKALGYKQGQILADETVNKVAQNESEGIKWLNSFTDRKNGVLAQISKQYNIKPGSKKSAAAQMYAEGFYVNDKNEIVAYGDRELAIDFPNLKVQENIKGLARDERIRQIYDETLEAINESRRRNLYPEIQRLDNYFLHFRVMEDIFSRLGLPFNPNDIRVKDLPTDLNGVTADLKPGQPYFASAMHRTGMRTSFDLLGGLERYLSSAKNQIYHIDDIQTLRALRNYIADTYGQAKGLESLDELTDEEAQYRIEQVYSSHLSTFAKFLNEEANILAGKTALIDRGVEGYLGREGLTVLDTINKQVGSNMVGWNVSSSLTNFLPVAQTFAKTNKYDFTKAFAQTVSSKIGSIFGKTDSFVENNPTIIRRKGAERFYRNFWQKAGDTGYLLMSAVDDISTELIVRTKYNELVRKGMDEQKASFEADKWVSRLMGDRSLGQQPQLYNSKMFGLVTKFQLEVRNQLDSQFYDTIQETKVSNEEIENKLLRNAKTAAKVTSVFFQLAAVQHLYGMAFESVAGYNPAFDIVEVLIKTLGFDDDEEDEDTVLDNIGEGFLALLEDLPYTSTLTGGRIPFSSALPSWESIKQIATGEDEYGNKKNRVETFKGMLDDTAPYYLLPTGYGQYKKTKQGLGMFSAEHPVSGSYTDSGSLRFPVEETPLNKIQAGVFGQYANENARTYFDEGYAPLKEKQIQEYKAVEMPIRDYWQYREDLKGLDTLEKKFDFIAGMDLPVEKKNILINNIVDRKEKVVLENYDDFENYEEFDFYAKNTEKYEFLESQGVSYKEYKSSEDAKENYDSIYSWYKNNPEKVIFSKAITDNVIEYKGYTSKLYDIRADKDSSGDSIRGTAKKKKKKYIWSLDIDEGAKYILFKNEYKTDDTYNYEIIDYLNNRDDISSDEMITILKELDFEVDDEGNISWD